MSTINDYVNTKALTKRITEVKEELAHLLHLESLLGIKKRGRPAKVAGGTGTGNPGKKAKRGKRRGGLSEGILKYLSTKGKEGAHVKDIANAVGTKPANVTAFAYSAKGKKTVKNLGKATFALKG